ncbi:MAG: hypothetical protein ABIJ91_03490 [Candidatus Kuenenbacteria bacterium]
MKKLSHKKIIIYTVIFAIVIAANIYFFQKSFNQDKKEAVNNPFMENLGTEINSRSFLSKETSVLENKLFEKLQKIGEWPVSPNKIGRTNPFLPYFEQ